MQQNKSKNKEIRRRRPRTKSSERYLSDKVEILTRRAIAIEKDRARGLANAELASKQQIENKILRSKKKKLDVGNYLKLSRLTTDKALELANKYAKRDESIEIKVFKTDGSIVGAWFLNEHTKAASINKFFIFARNNSKLGFYHKLYIDGIHRSTVGKIL